MADPKNQNNGGLPPQYRGGNPGFDERVTVPEMVANRPLDTGISGISPEQQRQMTGNAQQPQGGAYAQPMAFPEGSQVTPPPMFQAPQVQERAVMGPQVDYSQYGPYTQQMTDEQLASSQLEGLLASDSPYMRQAALSGQRTAAQRGALSSSISAGASQSAAIQAAAPIAAQDAQAYRQMASENAAAINNNNLAKMQSATSMATNKLQSLTALASTAMDAESRGKIAALNANAQSAISQMEIQASQEAQEFEAAHQRALAMFNQEGRMDLAAFEQAGRMDVAEFQQAGALEQIAVRQEGLADLEAIKNQYALEEIGVQGDIEAYLVDRQIQGEFAVQQSSNIAQILANIGASDMDPAQQLRAMRNAIATYNSFMPEGSGAGAGAVGGAAAGGGGNTGPGPGANDQN